MAVAREWRAGATPERATEYEIYFREVMLPRLSAVPGWQSGRLLQRRLGDEVEIVVINVFDSIEAIRAFAGADPEAAVIPTEITGMLTRYDERCALYEVTLDANTGQPPPA